MNESYLKSFILYCQAIEGAYNEWKNYWIKVLTDNDTSKININISGNEIIAKKLRKIYNLD